MCNYSIQNLITLKFFIPFWRWIIWRSNPYYFSQICVLTIQLHLNIYHQLIGSDLTYQFSRQRLNFLWVAWFGMCQIRASTLHVTLISRKRRGYCFELISLPKFTIRFYSQTYRNIAAHVNEVFFLSFSIAY